MGGKVLVSTQELKRPRAGGGGEGVPGAVSCGWGVRGCGEWMRGVDDVVAAVVSFPPLLGLGGCAKHFKAGIGRGGGFPLQGAGS